MKVKELRGQTNMSQREFAAYFKIPVRTLQEWEQERVEPQRYIVSMMETILRLRKIIK